MNKSIHLINNFMSGYVSLYSTGQESLRKEARACLVGTVASCLSVSTTEDREAMIDAIFVLGARIGDTRFEDGQDFVEFLKEKIPKID